MRIALFALVAIASVLMFWSTRRFFTAPDGKHQPGTRWLYGLTCLCGVVQIVDLVRVPSFSTPAAALALAMYTSGLVVWLLAVRVHWRRPPSLAFSRDAPEHLVTSGPYAVIRHPFYTSYLLGWFAAFVATGTWTSLAAALLMFGFFDRAARQEEDKFKASELSHSYAQYRARTGRYLPNPWKWLRAAESTR